MMRPTTARMNWSNGAMRTLAAFLTVLLLVAPMAFANDSKAPSGAPKTALAPTIPGRDPEAPPEGRGPGGLDFGAWRSDAPQRTAGAFAAEIARLNAAGDLHVALAADGFVCFEPRLSGGPVVCARSALEGACGYDWIVVIARSNAPPKARFEAHCLPVRAPRR